jgi:methionyl-tRNA formyltransferase
MKIIFAGTPEFAVPSLQAIVDSGHEVVAVITAPDKPSGRGLKLQPSPVKRAALQHKIKALQPVNLKDENFLEEVRNLNPEVMVVVAFRMMPRSLWSIPKKGTFNLHASLLPQYRGAAPINRAIMNGESETGLTTFFINDVMDTGEIILQKKMEIGADETAGELHDRMKTEGAKLIVDTLQLIEHGSVKTTLQPETGELKTAPKIFRQDGLIDWHKPAGQIFNLIRGLSPYPAAYFELMNPSGQKMQLKVYRSKVVSKLAAASAGTFDTDYKSYFHMACGNGWLSLEEVQPEGKGRMNIKAWLNGMRNTGKWKTVMQRPESN